MTTGDLPRFPHRIGRVIRAHGLAGDVIVQLFRPRPIEAAQLRYAKERPPRPVELVFEDGREVIYEVVGLRHTSPAAFVAHLAGVDDRDGADRLVGAFVDVDPLDGPSVLDEVDRVFGATVIDVETDRTLGTVDDIRDNGAQALLVVGEDELLIPWVDAFVEDVEEGPDGIVVRIRPIPGLLEANER